MNESMSFSANYEMNSEIVQANDNKPDNPFTVTASTNIKPNDIYALARAFLCIESMTHKKLQKMCYYAKAWYLAIYNTNLVSESFEAWVHGAVQPELYQRYRSYGYSDIPMETDKSNIPEEFLSFSEEVYKAYGHLSGDDLERINHTEDPWIQARGELKPWESCRRVISEESMKDYYRERLE